MNASAASVALSVVLGCIAAAAAEKECPAGLIGYMPLDRDLTIFTPEGTTLRGEVTRQSRAFADDLAPVPANTPRFAAGRFGTGVFVEPGFESGARFSARNLLPPAAAEMDAAESTVGYAPVGDSTVLHRPPAPAPGKPVAHPVMRRSGVLDVRANGAGSGALATVTASLIPGTYTLSFFAASGSARATAIRAAVVGPDGVERAGTDVTLTHGWQRCAVTFSNGRFTRDKAKQTPVTVRPSFVALAGPSTFSIAGVMLEMNGGYSYAATSGPGSWLPGDA